MKKAILTIGLFTLVLVSTSFASPKNTTTIIAENPGIIFIDGTGGHSVGGNKKVDFNGSDNNVNTMVGIDGTGGHSVGGNKKVD